MDTCCHDLIEEWDDHGTHYGACLDCQRILWAIRSAECDPREYEELESIPDAIAA